MSMKRKLVVPLALAVGVLGLVVVAQIASASHVRPKGATPLYASMVPAYNVCNAPGNRQHGPPLAFASCNPPVQSSNYLTLGTPDATGGGANSIGTVQLVVDAVPPEDVIIKASITDVRCRPAEPAAFCGTTNISGPPDYNGSVQGNATIRITDHYNGTSLTETATVIDTGFPVNANCTATATDTIGGTCSVNTTANAVLAGSVQDGKRAVVEVQQIKIFDGGADGTGSTAGDNTLFETQGIFIP
jgi:hypothetical protein